MLNIVLLGPPGSGKGTQADNIVKAFGLTHISTGACLREEIAAQTEIGKKIEGIIAGGNLVSDEIVNSIIERYEKTHSNPNGYLFDGFPRTESQARFLDDSLAKQNFSISAAIDLEVDSEELVRRIVYRGQLSGRADDNETTARKRIVVYQEKTQVLEAYYQRQNKLHAIKGTNSVDETWQLVKAIIEKL